MSCSQCPHCRALTDRADLLLPIPSPRSVPGGIDRAFYRAYGAAYDLARARSPQPVRLLREVNPGLTPDRCGQYLKRARSLGFVTSPGRDDRPGPVVVPAEGSDEWWASLTDEQLAAAEAQERRTAR